MDWIQFFTLMITIIGSTLAFYRFIHTEVKETFNKIDERISRMEVHHREDLHKMDEKIDKMDENHRTDLKKMDERLEKMDQKWERLFERLLLKDQAQGS